MKNGNLGVITLGLLAATVCPSAMSGQQPSQKACDLLTPAELGSVIGGKAGHASGTETPYQKNPQLGIDHDGVVDECVESFGDRTVTITFTAITATEARRGAVDKAKQKDAQQTGRNLGLQVQFKDGGASHCTTLFLPDGAKDRTPATGTACSLLKGGYLVGVDVSGTSSGEVLPAEKVATLAEKAAARLPSR